MSRGGKAIDIVVEFERESNIRQFLGLSGHPWEAIG